MLMLPPLCAWSVARKVLFVMTLPAAPIVRLLELLLIHDCAAPSVSERFALPTVVASPPALSEMPLPLMVSTWPELAPERV